MEQSKQFKRLPKAGRTIIIKFKQERKRKPLFDAVIADINSQNTINSRSVRRSNYRAILRTWFKFTDAELKPIEAHSEEKQRYFDKLKESAERKEEDIINKALLDRIMSIDVCELLIRSGLRVSELVENKFQFTKNAVRFQLNKKEDSKYYHDIHILGDIKTWQNKFNNMRTYYKGKTNKQVYDKINRALKQIIPVGFVKRSTHICRAIYVRMLYKFKRGTYYSRWGFPRIIQTFLHHDNLTSTAYYEHIQLSDDVNNIDIKA